MPLVVGGVAVRVAVGLGHRRGEVLGHAVDRLWAAGALDVKHKEIVNNMATQLDVLLNCITTLFLEPARPDLAVTITEEAGVLARRIESMTDTMNLVHWVAA